jgi:hypothetical protein
MEDDGYTLCSHCGEEYTEEELHTLDLSGTWQDNVCEICIDSYEDGKQKAIDAAIASNDEDWWERNHSGYL